MIAPDIRAGARKWECGEGTGGAWATLQSETPR